MSLCIESCEHKVLTCPVLCSCSTPFYSLVFFAELRRFASGSLAVRTSCWEAEKQDVVEEHEGAWQWRTRAVVSLSLQSSCHQSLCVAAHRCFYRSTNGFLSFRRSSSWLLSLLSIGFLYCVGNVA